jgi:hypothetical protein
MMSHNLNSTPNIRMSWAVFAACIIYMINTYKVFVEKPEEDAM